jgi:hypothetical protein
VKTEALADPDDITATGRPGTPVRGGGLYVAFQNGVGSQGEASTSGNTDSTIVNLTFRGRHIRQWDVKGKVDGMKADPWHHRVIATVNEDAHSSLYTIDTLTGKVTHYAYTGLTHFGGTDAVSILMGQIVISASAPGTTAPGGSAPANAPAAYVVQLHPGTKVARAFPLFADNAKATAINGPHAGHPVTLALTDPDSNGVVPAGRFAGQFLLDAQGDQQLIFGSFLPHARHLAVLSLPASIDDSAWATARHGAFFTTDSTANTVDAITGAFQLGAVYAAVTPCNANSAPSTCPAPPKFPANFLGTISLKTGAIAAVATTGARLTPKGLLFEPALP